MTEERAIQLCLRHRDPQGFEALVRQYRREAFHHAFALMGNEDDAADLCQDAFAQAFAAMPKLKSLDRFYPWFYRILRNRGLNLLSRRKTAATYARTETSHSDRSAEIRDPAFLAAHREEQSRVWAALEILGASHREILVLKYVQGKRYDEIAALLGVPRGTVMSRLHQARTAFRRIYEPEAQPRPQLAQ